MIKILKTKISLGNILLLAIALSATYFYFFYNKSDNPNQSIIQSAEMINYIEETSEMVFLNVGIEKVVSQTNNTSIPWTKIGIPLSEKKSIIILHYIAKLGIKEPAKIEKINETHYKIILPEYKIIGIELEEDNPYQLYDENKGLLSYSTKDIDTGALVAQTLSNEEQAAYIKRFLEILNSSAQNYYTTLFKALGKDIKVQLVYPNSK